MIRYTHVLKFTFEFKCTKLSNDLNQHLLYNICGIISFGYN
jgi:hypothetical protein